MNIYIIRNVIYKISYLENKSNTFRYPFKSTFTYSSTCEHVIMIIINVLIRDWGFRIGAWGMGPIPNNQ